jgi:hypothetical protein
MENLHGLNAFQIFAIVALAMCAAALYAKALFFALNAIEAGIKKLISARRSRRSRRLIL